MRFLIFSKSLCVAGPDSTLQVPMQKNSKKQAHGTLCTESVFREAKQKKWANFEIHITY